MGGWDGTMVDRILGYWVGLGVVTGRIVLNDLLDEFIGEPKDFVWDPGDKVEAGDQTVHLVLLQDLDLTTEGALDEIGVDVSTTTGEDDLDGSFHGRDRYSIGLGGE